MQRILIILLILTALACMGMGGVGGFPEGTVPETDVPINAKVMDRSGTETSLNQFSMEGQTYLDASRGQGKLTVPFQHIALINFGDIRGDEVRVEVKLKSGDTLDLGVRTRAFFYGSTGFGAFKIRARDLSRVEFP